MDAKVAELKAAAEAAGGSLSAGAKAVGGLGMLVHQGAAAFRIWTGLEPDVAAMFRAVEETP